MHPVLTEAPVSRGFMEGTVTIRALHRGVLWFGLESTAVFVLVAGPFLGGWVLSPLLWAAVPWVRSRQARAEV
ncbi:MAG: hypothetical protein OEN00_05920 [Gemmatimonadota bacterium]|nr:hypothetical protein [Gemmatimonadota bacterium]